MHLSCPLSWVRQTSPSSPASAREHWEGILGLVVLKSVISACHRFAISELWMGAEQQAGSANPDPFLSAYFGCDKERWRVTLCPSPRPPVTAADQDTLWQSWGGSQRQKKAPQHNESHQIVNKLWNHVWTWKWEGSYLRPYLQRSKAIKDDLLRPLKG